MPAARTRRASAPVDHQAARELDLYAENEGALYGQRMAIIESIKRKIKAKKYNPALAPKLWAYWYEAAAKRYAKEFASPGDWSRMFTKATRDHAAKERAADEYRLILQGEYDR